ncbi:MAG: hypothetical protein KDB03_24895 [Planctomycetales bacterium]|nr:hypothetical protein [Planctomycetales bacterium]
MLFSGPGDFQDAINLTWLFNDSAPFQLPGGGALISGIYQPGLEQWDDFFPAPGPGGKLNDADPAPWSYDFSNMLNQSPNGNWNLFVLDANSGDSGSITGGWSLQLTTAVPEPGMASLLLFGLAFLRPRSRVR